LKIACLEEIAYGMGYIHEEKLLEIASSMKGSSYGQYLLSVVLKEKDG
jgi:glucose-1-phosphate thymidylyltransferase